MKRTKERDKESKCIEYESRKKKANPKCEAFYLIKLRFSFDGTAGLCDARVGQEAGITVAVKSDEERWCWRKPNSICIHIIKNRLQMKKKNCRKTPRSF